MEKMIEIEVREKILRDFRIPYSSYKEFTSVFVEDSVTGEIFILKSRYNDEFNIDDMDMITDSKNMLRFDENIINYYKKKLLIVVNDISIYGDMWKDVNNEN